MFFTCRADVKSLKSRVSLLCCRADVSLAMELGFSEGRDACEEGEAWSEEVAALVATSSSNALGSFTATRAQAIVTRSSGSIVEARPDARREIVR